MTVGVITHLRNADFAEIRSLASAAEEASADWLGVPDAFWWRDTWVLLTEVARATERIAIGPLVTNPYLRHPFHTIAALATLQDLAGNRVFLGVGAGGSEVSGVAGVSRRDAPARIESLVDLLRAVSAGEPLDQATGRRLEVPLAPVPVLVGGRGAGVLTAAGRVADGALLWAIPASDVERSARLVQEATSERRAPAARPEIVWAPLVDHGAGERARVQSIAAYSVLNSSPELHRRWGLDRGALSRLRAGLVSGGAGAVADLVPATALEDLVLADPDPAVAAKTAAAIGAKGIALPAFALDNVGDRVAWARAVLEATEA